MRPEHRHHARRHRSRAGVCAFLHERLVYHGLLPWRYIFERRGVLLQTSRGLLGLELHRRSPDCVARDLGRPRTPQSEPLLQLQQRVRRAAAPPVHCFRARRVLRLQNGFGAGGSDPPTSYQLDSRARRGADAGAGTPGAWDTTFLS